MKIKYLLLVSFAFAALNVSAQTKIEKPATIVVQPVNTTAIK